MERHYASMDGTIYYSSEVSSSQLNPNHHDSFKLDAELIPGHFEFLQFLFLPTRQKKASFRRPARVALFSDVVLPAHDRELSV